MHNTVLLITGTILYSETLEFIHLIYLKPRLTEKQLTNSPLPQPPEPPFQVPVSMNLTILDKRNQALIILQ